MDKSPAPTCCNWLPTDSNLFVIGYKSSHIAFFDYNSGKVENSHEFFPEADEEGEVVCMDAHELSSQIVTGHLNGQMNIYDFKQNKVIQAIDCIPED